MQKNFWSDLYTKNKGKRPIIVLAPMADVTDIVFRNLIVEKSGIGEGSELDVLWSEFVSVNGLSHPVGREKLLVDLRYREAERPIVAQVFGEDPDKYEDTAKLCQELGFDGVDINMGCPDKNVLGQKSGSYLINTPEVAKQIVYKSKVGATNIPVTVKTRIGYNKIEYKEWLSQILTTKPTVITIHLRTKKEMSLVPAHWELAAEIVEFVRSGFGYPEDGGPIIILNGDVKDVPDAYKKWELSGCDGIMIGRGIFGNPWLFSKRVKKENLQIEEILLTALEHAKRFEQELGQYKSFAIMKKHFKAYVNGFPGAKELRTKLMDTSNAREVEEVITGFIRSENSPFTKIKRYLKLMFS
jgi:nifR3 family TIM-barrel protein